MLSVESSTLWIGAKSLRTDSLTSGVCKAVCAKKIKLNRINLIHLENITSVELILYPEVFSKRGETADGCSEFCGIHGGRYRL